MAGANRTAPDALKFLETLEREPYRYEFYEALRRLECLYDDEPRFGKAPRLADDPVRLAQEPSLAFAPASLASFDAGSEERPPRSRQMPCSAPEGRRAGSLAIGPLGTVDAAPHYAGGGSSQPWRRLSFAKRGGHRHDLCVG